MGGRPPITKLLRLALDREQMELEEEKQQQKLLTLEMCDDIES